MNHNKLTLNFENVEDLIFRNSLLQSKLTDFSDLFNQWKLGQFTPALYPMAQKAKLDLLNKLAEKDIALLEDFFQSKVSVERLDYSIVKNYIFNIGEEANINFSGECFISRNASQLYIGMWR